MVNKNSFICLSCVVLFFSKDAFSQQKEIDSLQSVIARSSDTTKFDAIISLVRIYAKNDNNKALKYTQQANAIAYDLGDSARIVNASRIIGQLLNRLSMSKEAEEILLKVLPVAKRNNCREEYKAILGNLAILYTYEAKYDKALKINFKILMMHETDKEYREASYILNNIGMVYYKLKNFEGALKFYEQAIKLKKSIRDTYDLDRLLINTGLCYNQLNEFSTALKYFQRAFKECNDGCSDQIKIEGKFGLGISNYRLENFRSAKEYFNQSLILAQKIDNKRFVSENLFSLAQIYLLENKKDLALKALKKSEQIAIKSSYNQILIDVYKEFIALYNQKNDFRNTLKYQNKYIQLKDSIYSEELTQNLMVAQAEYEQRENKAQIDSQRQMLFLKEEVISRQNWITTLAGITAALMIMLVFLLYRSNQQKKRVNQLLEQKVKERTKELEQNYITLQQTHQEQIQLVLKTSNDMKSPLTTMKGLCSLALKELPGTKAQEYLGQINTTTEHMSDLIGRLSSM